MPDGLFGALFAAQPVREATGDAAVVRAMLDAEVALAEAQAELRLIPTQAAAAIRAAARALEPDPVLLGQAGAAAGNPAVPLVRLLTEAVGPEHRGWVHWGATSQDIVDTALVLVARRAAPLILAEMQAAAAVCRALAVGHRDTVMAARTLLQQALPTTFGLKAAGWMVSLDQARVGLSRAVGGLPAQLGGAAGTLASLGPAGPAVLERFAARLALPAPVLAWHTLRAPVADLGAALAAAAGSAGKVALDISLLMQTEVAEVALQGAGGSSTLPHKRNPASCALVIAAARRASAAAGVLLSGLPQEHERAVGGWHGEWQSLLDSLALTGGAAALLRTTLDGLQVRPERMRANLERSGGLPMTEHVMMLLAPGVGRQEAHDLIEARVQQALATGDPLLDVLAGDPRITAHLDRAALAAALQPESYLGSASVFLDRAVDWHDRLGSLDGPGGPARPGE